jgi:UDP-N-acetylmuramoylalanine--D-glutamate ligase
LVACLPNTGHRLAEALRNQKVDVEIIEAEDLQSAMSALHEKRELFDTLILSPAAPSYNQFRDYVERGEKFVELAKTYFT